MIRFENVTYTYPFSDRCAVKDINLHVRPGELVLVSGGFTRRTAIVPRARLQRMRVSQSPFQRRAGVAMLSVRTAAGTEEGLSLRDVPVAEADALLAWFRPQS